MSDLIERSALLKDLKSDCPESDVCIADTSCIECIIGRQPTIEAEPVKHGWWLNAYVGGDIDTKKCSECSCYIELSYFANDYKVRYCPSCGAKMDGGKKQ